MTTAIQQDMDNLAESLRSSVLRSRVEFKSFASGAGWIDVFLDERLYQMVYSPTHRVFGVDEALEDDPPFSMYYRFTYPDFDSAARQLRALVKGEVHVSANGVAQ